MIICDFEDKGILFVTLEKHPNEKKRSIERSRTKPAKNKKNKQFLLIIENSLKKVFTIIYFSNICGEKKVFDYLFSKKTRSGGIFSCFFFCFEGVLLFTIVCYFYPFLFVCLVFIGRLITQHIRKSRRNSKENNLMKNSLNAQKKIEL